MTSATIKEMLEHLSEEQLFELKKEVEQRLCMMVPERPIVSDSADPMVLFANKYTMEDSEYSSADWVYHRYDTRISFRPSGETHAYQCDSSVAPIDSYEKFVKNVVELKTHALETNGETKPFEVSTMKRGDMVDSELIFVTGFSGMKPVNVVDSSKRKPVPILEGLTSNQDLIQMFSTTNEKHMLGKSVRCTEIFKIGKYTLYMIDDIESAVYILADDEDIVDYFDGASGGEPVFRLYEDDRVLAIGPYTCTILNPVY